MSIHPIDRLTKTKTIVRDGGDVIDELRLLPTYSPGRDEDAYTRAPCRPLGILSDFVVDSLGSAADDVLAGSMSAADLLDVIEQHAQSVPKTVLPTLLETPNSTDATVAAVDLALVERVLSVAHLHGDRDAYRIRRNSSHFFTMSFYLATAKARYPFLQWTDISEDYPIFDPRTLLSPGHDRFQEIHLYRAQSAIERGSRRIVEYWADGHPGVEAQHRILELCDGIAKSMANVSRKRQPGEFDKLDRFLSPNDEVVGHGTGSFSAWTKLAGYLCTGRKTMLGAVTDPRNAQALTLAARQWLSVIESDQVRPLGESDALFASINKRCTDFHLIHRGAVRRHAPSAMGCPAPSIPSISNIRSMNRNITGRN